MVAHADARKLPEGVVRSNVPRYFLNSVIISLGSTGLALVLAIFASYGFARFEFAGKRASQAFVLTAQLLPTSAIIVPLFITLRVLGLVNTYLGLILVYMIPRFRSACGCSRATSAQFR
jgi:ABC-type glycerol-3-phosphate transport system permease component